MQTPGFDICTAMQGDKVNPTLKMLIDQMSADTPIFRKCPYNGTVEIRNFAIKGDGAFGIYPAGVYQISVTLSRKKNKVDLAIVTSVISYKMNRN